MNACVTPGMACSTPSIIFLREGIRLNNRKTRNARKRRRTVIPGSWGNTIEMIEIPTIMKSNQFQPDFQNLKNLTMSFENSKWCKYIQKLPRTIQIYNQFNSEWCIKKYFKHKKYKLFFGVFFRKHLGRDCFHYEIEKNEKSNTDLNSLWVVKFFDFCLPETLVRSNTKTFSKKKR